jgi:hypothetical protein
MVATRERGWQKQRTELRQGRPLNHIKQYFTLEKCVIIIDCAGKLKPFILLAFFVF